MTEAIGEELRVLKNLAEEGRSAPLLGGGRMILFGAATVLASLYNWAVITGLIALSPYSIALVWFGAMGLAAFAGQWMSRSEADLPGAHSTGNRVERAVWQVAGPFLALLAAGIFVAALRLSQELGASWPWSLFWVMSPMFFGVYAIALSASATAANMVFLRPFVWLSLALTGVTAVLAADPTQLLVQAAGALLVAVVPGIRMAGFAKSKLGGNG